MTEYLRKLMTSSGTVLSSWVLVVLYKSSGNDRHDSVDAVLDGTFSGYDVFARCGFELPVGHDWDFVLWTDHVFGWRLRGVLPFLSLLLWRRRNWCLAHSVVVLVEQLLPPLRSHGLPQICKRHSFPPSYSLFFSTTPDLSL
jgi:hypothetical protein